eukprot:CAMPEP_0201520454 /NCGR_PEP_ID=MMETSP0161_2-20130828/11364_1 /ASSEMBLY_ACC=CAM_ASM_000251 /TAXON_ID=180227 /ORGANISM="Neoparamoeba aestuarina, Strain SoJaBio B1-5/56/2" /LENGTH=168 /DNA_ID=CAMNT_0047918829 /DNA_START=56 /DNA_END=562 /DNA_ORIENTATION=-
MANPKCAICDKTVYPLEKFIAGDKAYHKWCFKCAECNITLNLKNFKALDGKIYCFTHTPVDRASTSADSVAVTKATNAPKRVAEGLSQVQKGTGEKPSQDVDMRTQKAMDAPKKKAEGLAQVQKGTGEKPSQDVDLRTQKAMSAPKAEQAGQLGVSKGTGEAPTGVQY